MPPSHGCITTRKSSWTGRLLWSPFLPRPLAKRRAPSGQRPALPTPASLKSQWTPCGNVLGILPAAALPPESSGPVVVLSAHLDTVFPAETALKPVINRNGGALQLSAPGACDNAAGVAGMLAIVHALIQAQANLAVRAPCGAGQCWRRRRRRPARRAPLLSTSTPFAGRIAAHIVLDGAGADSAVTQALGSRRFQITISGPGGHSFTDAGTPNPIAALGQPLSPTLAQTPLPEAPRTTLNLGTIHGGTSVNSIPESAAAAVDFRSTSAEELCASKSPCIAPLKTPSTIANDRAHVTQPGTAQPRARSRFTSKNRRPPCRAVCRTIRRMLEALRAVDRHLGLQHRSRVSARPTPIFPSRSACPRSLWAPAAKAAARTRVAEWYSDKDREARSAPRSAAHPCHDGLGRRAIAASRASATLRACAPCFSSPACSSRCSRLLSPLKRRSPHHAARAQQSSTRTLPPSGPPE